MNLKIDIEKHTDQETIHLIDKTNWNNLSNVIDDLTSIKINIYLDDFTTLYVPEYSLSPQELSDFKTSGNALISINDIFGNYPVDGFYTVIAKGLISANATQFADAGGGNTTVTSANHKFSNGDTLVGIGTTNYNGTFIISGVTTNTFVIPTAFVVDDATGVFTLTYESNTEGLAITRIAKGSVYSKISNVPISTISPEISSTLHLLHILLDGMEAMEDGLIMNRKFRFDKFNTILKQVLNYG